MVLPSGEKASETPATGDDDVRLACHTWDRSERRRILIVVASVGLAATATASAAPSGENANPDAIWPRSPTPRSSVPSSRQRRTAWNAGLEHRQFAVINVPSGLIATPSTDHPLVVLPTEATSTPSAMRTRWAR